MFSNRFMAGLTSVAMGLSSAACAQTGAAGDSEPARNLWLEVEPVEHEHNSMSIVLISGDEEYRSEEALPQLARILACRHGFTCTVLFAIDEATGEINPDNRGDIPGLGALADADLMIIATRFRDLPDEQMAMIDAYVQSGRPIIGLRTATHAFNMTSESAYRHYTWNFNSDDRPEWNGGFGRAILGETWVAHHGAHGTQSTRGLIADGAQAHPIARGIGGGGANAPWGPTDVYTVRALPSDATPIVLGQVLDGMSPGDEADPGEKNQPMMPVAWTRVMKNSGNAPGRRVFTTTMGAATDLLASGTRTMLVNAAYWAMGLEDEIPEGGCESGPVGEFTPTDFGFGGFVKGTRPSDYETGCE